MKTDTSNIVAAFKAGMKECKRVGTAHAQGDALRAMYANLIGSVHGGNHNSGDWRYFGYLMAFEGEQEITRGAKVLLNNREKAWEVLQSL